MTNAIIHGCHHSFPRVSAPRYTSTPGTMNTRICVRKAKRTEYGWSRRSDDIGHLSRQQMVANRERNLMFQAGEFDPGVLRTRRVDDQVPETVLALERPLGDVGVLHSRARHVRYRTPEIG